MVYRSVEKLPTKDPPFPYVARHGQERIRRYVGQVQLEMRRFAPTAVIENGAMFCRKVASKAALFVWGMKSGGRVTVKLLSHDGDMEVFDEAFETVEV